MSPPRRISASWLLAATLVAMGCMISSATPLLAAVPGAEVASVESADADAPNWLSVVPPLLAIALALATRQVVIALLLGVYVGALILVSGNPLTAFLRVGDHYLLQALSDDDHAAILLFSSMLGGMVGVLARGGGTQAVVARLARRIKDRRGGQLATVGMGTVIFFDDYANTLLVGSTMRPLSDRLRISREKLSYLVDSTAAPVTTLAVISTWIGFEVGLIHDALERLGGSGAEAYSFFVRSIPYGFYPILTLIFVYLVAGLGRDFGPMLAAERRAATTGEVLRPGARPAGGVKDDAATATEAAAPEVGSSAHPALAIVPIVMVVLITALGLAWDGRQGALAQGIDSPGLRDVLNHADSFAVLTWAALGGSVVAVVLAVASRRLSLATAIDGWIEGVKAMIVAVVILLLAWSLSAVCAELGTAEYLVAVSRGVLSAHLLPVVTFVLAAAMSFATGTSWGTMAILMPLIFHLGAILPAEAGLDGTLADRIHLASVSAVLAGAVFGDHCSPISDTTILSSLATGADHVDHVRTQLPYASVVAGVAMLVGYLPVGFGMPPLLSLLMGTVLVLAIMRWWARPVVPVRRGEAGR